MRHLSQSLLHRLQNIFFSFLVAHHPICFAADRTSPSRSPFRPTPRTSNPLPSLPMLCRFSQKHFPQFVLATSSSRPRRGYALAASRRHCTSSHPPAKASPPSCSPCHVERVGIFPSRLVSFGPTPAAAPASLRQPHAMATSQTTPTLDPVWPKLFLIPYCVAHVVA